MTRYGTVELTILDSITSIENLSKKPKKIFVSAKDIEMINKEKMGPRQLNQVDKNAKGSEGMEKDFVEVVCETGPGSKRKSRDMEWTMLNHG